MNQQKSYDGNNGRFLREDGSYTNFANHIAPIPNGDESIVAASAGVKTLTPPAGSIKAIITNPVAVWVRFSAVPAVGTGTLYAKDQGIVLESIEEITDCQIYVTGACTIFVQYEK